MKYIKAKDGKWYGVSEYDACCVCGLTHEVEYRLNKGKLERRSWMDKLETNKNIKKYGNK